MLSIEDNERLTRVGPGTPMGDLFRRYWQPVALSETVSKPDGPPIRVRMLGEDLVLFRATDGRFGLVAERCPHRTASMYWARNEENGLRCVYHGLKFDVDGNCVDAPCVTKTSEAQLESLQRQLKIKAYPCIERAELVWAYMGPPEFKPAFPELDWTLVPTSHRLSTRHIQECNWLQALEGGFDAAHLTFLHKGETSHVSRTIVPTLYEVQQNDAGFYTATGRDMGDGQIYWNTNALLMPAHKIISAVAPAAHMWMPIDDENTMLYSTEFRFDGPLTEKDLERVRGGKWIHTVNLPGTDISIRNKSNDYLVDRGAQATGQSYTGMQGLGIQDCAVQESMGPIADRTQEFLLPCDIEIVKIRRLYLQALDDMASGKPLMGMTAADYRMRMERWFAPKGDDIAVMMAERKYGKMVKAGE